eukprot:s242_g22.t1
MAGKEKQALSLVSSLAVKSGLIFNVGSVAHPEFCAAPCAFFAAGKCTSGAACRMCHGSHEKAPKYDKRQRATWKNLSASDVLAWLDMCLRDRAQKVGLSDEVQPILQLLQEEIKVLPFSPPQILTAQRKNLLKYFVKRSAWKMIHEALHHRAVDKALLGKASLSNHAASN